MRVIVVEYYCEMNESAYLIGVFDHEDTELIDKYVSAYCLLRDGSTRTKEHNILYTHTNLNKPYYSGFEITKQET